MTNCAECGKTLGLFERNTYWNRQLQKGYLDMAKPLIGFSQGYRQILEYQNKKLCESCAYHVFFGEQFKQAVRESRRQAIVTDMVKSNDGVPKHLQLASKVAEEHGFVLKSESHSIFDGGGISMMMIFEKVIPTANETNFVNCTHCTSRYDANQYFKCPQCGAPTT